MCTVTLIPTISSANGFILTSNRDEAANREALFPDFYLEDKVKMLYPKDKLAGGTWIGVSEHKRLICLLNGEFKKHVREDNYRLSRGVVVKDLLAAEDFKVAIDDYNLQGVEPFTVVLVDWYEQLQFVELVWDGNKKHYLELPIKPQIWSSSPLYSEDMKALRVEWFERFKNTRDINPKDLLEFHHNGGIGDPELDLVMDRGYVKTQSITQIVKSEKFSKMIYEDLKSKKITEIDFSKEL